MGGTVAGPSISDPDLQQYLLGTLDEDSRVRLEERYLEDHALFERLLVIEDELTEAYLRGELQPTERLSFEQRFLATDRGREKVESARALLHCLAETEGSADLRSAQKNFRRWWVFSSPSERLPQPGRLMAAAAVALTIAVVALGLVAIWQQRELRDARLRQVESAAREQRNRVEAESQLARADGLAEELRRQRAAGKAGESLAAPRAVAIALTPGLLRDSTQPVVSVAPGAELVVLELRLGQFDDEQYRIVLSTVEGRAAWQQDISRPAAKEALPTLAVVVPAARLSADDYVLVLKGRSGTTDFMDVASYSFRVVRE